MKKILLLVLLFSLPLAAYNQVIKGTIVDKDTKSPIYSAANAKQIVWSGFPLRTM